MFSCFDMRRTLFYRTRLSRLVTSFSFLFQKPTRESVLSAPTGVFPRKDGEPKNHYCQPILMRVMLVLSTSQALALLEIVHVAPKTYTYATTTTLYLNKRNLFG